MEAQFQQIITDKLFHLHMKLWKIDNPQNSDHVNFKSIMELKIDKSTFHLSKWFEDSSPAHL